LILRNKGTCFWRILSALPIILQAVGLKNLTINIDALISKSSLRDIPARVKAEIEIDV